MKVKIAINKPCQENWNAMSPTQKGAFCAVCKKDVIDFTKTPASQFKNKLKNASCGRFTAAQLAEEYDFSSSNRFSKVAAAIGLTTILAGTGAAHAQTQLPKVEQHHSKNEALKNVQLTGLHKPQDTLRIKGQVVDENSEPLFGATVLLKGTNRGVTTDFDGFYELLILDPENFPKIVLIISSTGYKQQEIAYSSENKNPTILTYLHEQYAVLGFISVETYTTRRTFFGRILNVFRKKENWHKPYKH